MSKRVVRSLVSLVLSLVLVAALFVAPSSAVTVAGVKVPTKMNKADGTGSAWTYQVSGKTLTATYTGSSYEYDDQASLPFRRSSDPVVQSMLWHADNKLTLALSPMVTSGSIDTLVINKDSRRAVYRFTVSNGRVNKCTIGNTVYQFYYSNGKLTAIRNPNLDFNDYEFRYDGQGRLTYLKKNVTSYGLGNEYTFTKYNGKRVAAASCQEYHGPMNVTYTYYSNGSPSSCSSVLRYDESTTSTTKTRFQYYGDNSLSTILVDSHYQGAGRTTNTSVTYNITY